MPCLITALAELNAPRYMTAGSIIDAHRDLEITEWTVADVTVDPNRIGLAGSPTKVQKSFT